MVKVFEDQHHNAFTSLVKFRDQYYCAFRSGEKHVYGKDGVIRIMASEDGKQWIAHGIIEKEGYDLRDPKLSITPDDRMMLLIGGSVYRGKTLVSQKTHVSFSDNQGKNFTAPIPIELDPDFATNFDWLWRVTWNQGRGFGVIYQREKSSTTLLTTQDGVKYSMVKRFDLDGRPNEATVRFLSGGEMLIMHRREEGNQRGFWGRSRPPYQDWTWTSMNYRLGGPDFCVLQDGAILAGSRIYHDHHQSVGLLLHEEQGNFKLIHEFSSDGDCSYPAFVVEPNRILMSYYATQHGNTNIYLAEIPTTFIQP